MTEQIEAGKVVWCRALEATSAANTLSEDFNAAGAVIADALAAHRIAGEQAGRIAVVEWLRGMEHTNFGTTAMFFADRIESGRHLSAIRALKGPQA